MTSKVNIHCLSQCVRRTACTEFPYLLNSIWSQKNLSFIIFSHLANLKSKAPNKNDNSRYWYMIIIQHLNLANNFSCSWLFDWEQISKFTGKPSKCQMVRLNKYLLWVIITKNLEYWVNFYSATWTAIYLLFWSVMR